MGVLGPVEGGELFAGPVEPVVAEVFHGVVAGVGRTEPVGQAAVEDDAEPLAHLGRRGPEGGKHVGGPGAQEGGREGDLLLGGPEVADAGPAGREVDQPGGLRVLQDGADGEGRRQVEPAVEGRPGGGPWRARRRP